ncbi:aminotransferase class IV [Nocardia sp. NPDC056100]|uniref:aminotransferase class IV n=1 Tax=Nocardia sp. NPDC056100 TaxID=3345712 RepID=UPI0035E1E544
MDELTLFDPDTGELVPAPSLDGPDVMDSWLLVDGRVRCLELHEQRFTASVALRHDIPEETIAAFLLRMRDMLPTRGHWFPRIECSRLGDLGLRVRRAPELSDTVRLWTATVPDPRAEPRVKGPDQGRLAELRRIATHFGSEEPVLLDPDGYLREGAFSAIGWWRDGTLCFPDPDAPVLPSVTRQLIEAVAGMRGVAVEYERVRPADITGLPVWVLSALHGIREAVHWTGNPAPASTEGARDEWQDALGRFATRIDRATPYPGEIQHA